MLFQFLLLFNYLNLISNLRDYKEKIFIYGNDNFDKKRKPYTLFQFEMLGNESMIDYFKTVPTMKKWPKTLPQTSFFAKLKITCKYVKLLKKKYCMVF